jgi:tetratricopeptide (TPR) repeat protein
VGRLATALALQLSYGYRTTMASYPTAARALALAERAVSLDPTHGESVGFRAYIEYLTFAPVDSVRADFGRAIALHPGEADVAGWHALLLLREGEVEQSLAEARRALELDPASSARHLTLALAAFGAQRYDLAALEARRAGETEPELRRPRQIEGLALLMLGRPTECIALDLRPYLGTRAMCLRAAGKNAEAAAVLDTLKRLVDAPAADEHGRFGDVIPPQELATYYAWLGSAPEALRYIRLTFARSPVGLDQRFTTEFTRLQTAVWPRVQSERRKLDANDRATPLTE